ncbi:hypothetical protein SPZE110945_14855 [Sphingomonas zeae]
MVADEHGGKRRVGLIDGARHRRRPRRFLNGDARDRGRRALDLREILVDPAVQLRGIEIARHHQHRIVRPVIGGVERANIVDARRLQFLQATDARPRIGVHRIGELGIIDGEQLAIGLGEGALAQLLLHHVAFAGEALGLDDQRGHAIRLGEQQALQVVGRHHLEIIGVIVGSRGVVVAADILGQAIHLFGDEVARRLEHEMLEHVCKARATLGIVLRPDIIPDLDRDVGRRGVANGIDTQAVRQGARREIDGLYALRARWLRRLRPGQRGKGGNAEQ